MNPWLELSNARKVAAELQQTYCGASIDIEDEILQEMWDHPLCPKRLNEFSWVLNIIWDDFDCVIWLQIITQYGAVPK